MVLFTPVSGNAKTGPIPVSGSQADTCPPACPFAPKDGKPNGCYAAYGPINWHWTKLNKGSIGFSWNDFLAKVKQIPMGQLWRHNQFGDLKGLGNAICPKSLKELVSANRMRKGFTYTHKPVLDSQDREHATANRNAVKHANANGFTVNLSANNLDHADKLKELNIGPVVTIVPANSENTLFTKAGHKVIVCPAQQKEGITCATCRLCSHANRSVIVGFKSHGMGAKHVEKIAVNAPLPLAA
jgi:hypothetical protein